MGKQAMLFSVCLGVLIPRKELPQNADNCMEYDMLAHRKYLTNGSVLFILNCRIRGKAI